MTTRLGVIVLAAGRGTRMKSGLPKVLHPILGIPMAGHVLRAVGALSPSDLVLVADEDYEAVHSFLPQCGRVVVQDVPLGTADAVWTGARALSRDVDTILVINGDVPLVPADALRSFVEAGASSPARMTVMTFMTNDPGKYGRIVRRDGRVTGVVEAADDARAAGELVEVNGGVYLFDAGWLRESIGGVRVSASGEYYLTSLFALAARAPSEGEAILTVAVEPEHLVGVDDRVRLAQAEAILRRRVLTRLMQSGVTVVDPERTTVEPDVVVERDARIEPGSILRGSTHVEREAVVGPYTVLEDARIGVGAVVKHSWVSGSVVGPGVHIGPYSHLRPGTRVAHGAHIGNYVEMKEAQIGAGTRIGHFSYIGDAEVGANVNIGAGAITCNYDGRSKHRTIIGDDVFVGSDTMLVAPVELGSGSRTGAGSVVTRSVPPGKTVVGVPARVIGPAAGRDGHRKNGEDGR